MDKYVSSGNVNLIIPPILCKFKFTNEEFVMKRIELPRVLGAGRQPNARTHSRPRPRQVGGMFLRSGGGKTPDKMPQKYSVNSFL